MKRLAVGEITINSRGERVINDTNWNFSREGRPAKHSLEQCADLQKWRNEEIQKALHGGNRGGGPGLGGNPGNRPPLHENSGPGNGGNDQNRDGRVGFQQNPKQLGQYHIHTIHATKRDRKLIERAVTQFYQLSLNT